ncbi:MAG TPA: adenylate/guanylate cyclase domain-containing protein [Elusimicrobiota bacterium]|nr:adenylate/guanylate cyclase domain-containing protein [Elusimicrobiota bacterium]
MDRMVVLTLQGSHGGQASTGAAHWIILRNAGGPSKDVPVAASPFLIGRAKDCNLVLPEDAELRAATSRWHSYLVERDGKHFIADGSYKPLPETGRRKPSITGTLVNGKRIADACELQEGDLITIGPWNIRVSLRERGPRPSEDDGIFRQVAAAQSRKVDTADPRIQERFGELHELVCRLAQIRDFDESLAALLSYSTVKIKPAESAAVLLTTPGKGFEVRLAWDRRSGRVSDFRISESLLASLPPDRSYLLESKMRDPSLSQSINDISSGLLLPLWAKGERLGVFYMDNRRSGQSFTDQDLYLASAIASLISLQLTLERHAQLARIEANMSRYFAPDVVQRIIEKSRGEEHLDLEVQEKDVTVLFVDMEGFTSMSRTMPPREVSKILNPYLGVIARCIQSEGGHVNKFIGDSVMGIFSPDPGSSESKPERYAEQALRASFLIPYGWEAEAKALNLPPMRLRMGIGSGRAVVGNIGYSARLEYSVLGDPVNVAARLEKLAPPNRAAVSPETRRLAGSLFEFEDLGEREIKGLGKMQVFSPIEPPASDSSVGKRKRA